MVDLWRGIPERNFKLSFWSLTMWEDAHNIMLNENAGDTHTYCQILILLAISSFNIDIFIFSLNSQIFFSL